MRVVRATRLGKILCIGIIVIANLVQPASTSALGGLPVPLLDVLLGTTQSNTPSHQPSTPSKTDTTPPPTDQTTGQVPTPPSDQLSGDNPTEVLQLKTPVVIPVTPSPNNLANPIVLGWNPVDGADHYEYYYSSDPKLDCKTISGQPTANGQTSVELPRQSDGTYYWCVRAMPPTVSDSPLASEWSTLSPFVIDTTPPVVTLPAPGTIKDGAQITFTVTDANNLANYTGTITNEKGDVVHTDGPIAFPDQNHSYSYAWPGGLPNGEYTLKLVATDAATNESSSVSVSLILANDLPTTTAMIGPNNQTADDDATLTISGQASLNTKVVHITTTSGTEVTDVTPKTDGSWSYTFGNLHVGTYRFNVYAIDGVGNTSPGTEVSANVVAYVPLITEVISPDLTTSLSRPSAFTPLTTIVPLPATNPLAQNAAPSIASIAPDVSIDSSGKATALSDDSGQVLAASTTGWHIFGISWQWWALVVAIAAAGWWWIRRSHPVPQRGERPLIH